jgi:hypothetical protein
VFLFGPRKGGDKVADGTIIIDTKIDNNGIEKGVKSIESVASTGLKVFTGAVVGAGASLGALGVASIKTASDLSEVQNVVDTTFGSSASQINDWANKADTAFGLSTLQAKQFTGTLGAMLKSSGVASTELVGMSENMVGLAGDFASFYNLKPEEAFEKLRSGISGETEPLKALGINMSVANLQAYALSKGVTKSWESMSQGEQVQLRYNYLMNASKDAQGDFAKTSDSFANQMRIASLNVKSLFADIGQLLLPVAQKAVKSFNDVSVKLREAFKDEKVKENIKNIAEKIGDLVTKAANFIADNLPKILDGLDWLLTNGDKLIAIIVGIGVAIKTFETIVVVVKALNQLKEIGGIMSGLQLGLTALGGPVGLVVGLVAGLVAGIVILWNTNEGFRGAVTGIWGSIQTAFQNFDTWLQSIFSTDWSQSFGILGEYLNALLANVSGIWNSIKQVFNGVVEFVSGVFTGNWSQAWQGIVDIFGGIFGGIASVAKAPLNAVISLINMAIDGLNSISVDIPSFIPGIGGEHFGVNIPKISYLYTGGVFDKPTLIGGNTVVGDANNGRGSQREWVLPDKLLRETIGEEVGNKLSGLFSLMQDTVGYETAKTTANVVAQNNVTIQQANQKFEDKTTKQPKFLLENVWNVDGKELVREVVAPHQKELDAYYEGR